MIYFVTGNKNKYEEIKRCLSAKIKMKNIPYPEIQADRLEDVALYGIEFLKERLDENFFIEDSGLFIKELNGFPGVFSSYVFRTIGNEGIKKLMDGINNREAEFISVIAFYDGKINIFKGVCKGIISEEIRGEGGFGYDPIFIPYGSEKTFAEMRIEEKNEYSHRGKAIRKLKEYLDKKFRI